MQRLRWHRLARRLLGVSPQCLEAVGGLLDICILGSGDHHMAVGLAGRELPHPDLTPEPRFIARAIRAWQERAAALAGQHRLCRRARHPPLSRAESEPRLRLAPRFFASTISIPIAICSATRKGSTN